MHLRSFLCGNHKHSSHQREIVWLRDLLPALCLLLGKITTTDLEPLNRARLLFVSFLICAICCVTAEDIDEIRERAAAVTVPVKIHIAHLVPLVLNNIVSPTMIETCVAWFLCLTAGQEDILPFVRAKTDISQFTFLERLDAPLDKELLVVLCC